MHNALFPSVSSGSFGLAFRDVLRSRLHRNLPGRTVNAARGVTGRMSGQSGQSGQGQRKHEVGCRRSSTAEVVSAS